MKKLMIVLMAATLFSAALPGFALALTHGGGHDPADVNCARDCELLLKDCAHDADSIQQKIEKLESAIKQKGTKPETVADVKMLQQKLDDANEMLRSLQKGGH